MRVLYTAITLLLLSLCSRAQNCYYPNGEVSNSNDGACNTGDSACCPLGWQCMSNGLCYLEGEMYYGRYTCTDQSWESDNCPKICDIKTASNGTDSGDEAILQCDRDIYCCDGDRTGMCCVDVNAVMFNLPRGTVMATISTVSAPSSVPSTTNDATTIIMATSTFELHSTLTFIVSTDEITMTRSSSSSTGISTSASSTSESTTAADTSNSASTSSSSSSSTSASTTAAAPPVTNAPETSSYTETSLETLSSNGQLSTRTLLSVVVATFSGTPAPTPTPETQTPEAHTNLGLAIGIPLGIIGVAAILFSVYRTIRERRKAKRRAWTRRHSQFSIETDSMAEKRRARALGRRATATAPGEQKLGKRWSERYGAGAGLVEADGKPLPTPPPTYMSPGSWSGPWGGSENASGSGESVAGRAELD